MRPKRSLLTVPDTAAVLQRGEAHRFEDGLMALVIVERHVSGVVVLDTLGSLTVQAGTHTLSAQVLRCLDSGQRRFVINLREVCDCDTAGIAALVTSLTHVTGRGGRLILADVPPDVRLMLQTMKLLADFEVSTDETSAVTALGVATDV